jgi:hypothetical protein
VIDKDTGEFEVVEGASGLNAVVSVRRNLLLAQKIAFGSSLLRAC